MRMLSLSLAAAMALSPTVVLAAGAGDGAKADAPKPAAVPGFDVNNLDRSVKPCEDFNQFANGGWMAKNPVPAEYPTWGTFSALRDRNLDALHEKVDRLAGQLNLSLQALSAKLPDKPA